MRGGRQAQDGMQTMCRRRGLVAVRTWREREERAKSQKSVVVQGGQALCIHPETTRQCVVVDASAGLSQMHEVRRRYEGRQASKQANKQANKQTSSAIAACACTCNFADTSPNVFRQMCTNTSVTLRIEWRRTFSESSSFYHVPNKGLAVKERHFSAFATNKDFSDQFDHTFRRRDDCINNLPIFLGERRSSSAPSAIFDPSLDLGQVCQVFYETFHPYFRNIRQKTGAEIQKQMEENPNKRSRAEYEDEWHIKRAK
jgi:hypothetical protein